MGRCRTTSRLAVFGLNDCPKTVGQSFMLSHFHERANECSHHVFEKTISFYSDGYGT